MSNIDELVKLIIQTKPKRVLLQLPDGLRKHAIEIIDKLQETSIEIILSASSCYGACCLAVGEAIDVKADLLVHVGHNDFTFQNIKKDVPVLFYPWKLKIKFDSLDIDEIKENNLGLVATIQYMDELPKLQAILNNKTCINLGQVLGCHIPAIPKGIEAIVYLGTGQFHPTAFNSKPVKVYSINPVTGNVDFVEKDEIIEQKKLAAAKSKLDDAQSVGILVSTYLGQQKLDKAFEIKKTLEKRDKKSYIIYINEINEKTVQELDIDAFINTACPRIRQDYLGKPVINADDLGE